MINTDEVSLPAFLMWTIKNKAETIFMSIMSTVDKEFIFNINAYDEYGNTFLMAAVISQNVKMVNVLLNRGADIHRENYAENTPLVLAVWGGNLDIVKLLVNHGANIEDVNNWNTPIIQIAKDNGYMEVVEYLKGVKNEKIS